MLAHRMGKRRSSQKQELASTVLQQQQLLLYLIWNVTIYMGKKMSNAKPLNVFRMELLGAKVQSVTDGSRVLKDAVNAALRAWVANVEDTHYIMGSALGPHPFPRDCP